MKSIEGITYAKNPSKGETFVEDTSILTKFTEANLKSTAAIIKAFAKISGLHANLDKTMVVPLGGSFEVDNYAKICKELDLVWTDTFTLLQGGIFFRISVGIVSSLNMSFP